MCRLGGVSRGCQQPAVIVQRRSHAGWTFTAIYRPLRAAVLSPPARVLLLPLRERLTDGIQDIATSVIGVVVAKLCALTGGGPILRFLYRLQ